MSRTVNAQANVTVGVGSIPTLGAKHYGLVNLLRKLRRQRNFKVPPSAERGMTRKTSVRIRPGPAN